VVAYFRAQIYHRYRGAVQTAEIIPENLIRIMPAQGVQSGHFCPPWIIPG
jgi:hypothetical protein